MNRSLTRHRAWVRLQKHQNKREWCKHVMWFMMPIQVTKWVGWEAVQWLSLHWSFIKAKIINSITTPTYSYSKKEYRAKFTKYTFTTHNSVSIYLRWCYCCPCLRMLLSQECIEVFVCSTQQQNMFGTKILSKIHKWKAVFKRRVMVQTKKKMKD